MQAVIMAGGFGTRIQSVNNNVPKPLIKVNNIPVLERTIIQLQKCGIKDIILTVSYLKDMIIEYFGNGSQLGVNIDYFVEDKPLGSAGALFKLKNRLQNDFFVINGDIVFDVDLNKMMGFHRDNDAMITLFSHPNSHPFDSTLLDIDNNRVVGIFKDDNKPRYYRNCVNAGLHIINSKVLTELCKSCNKEKMNLDSDVIYPMIKTNNVFAYQSTEYVKDMGTPDRLKSVEIDLKNGKVINRNIARKQKAFFLDRDGTINKHVGFLRNIDDFELIPGVSKAIKKINDSDYLCIVVTNQPVIARGEVSIEELDEIHKKLETLLGNDGAYIDALYYCPHHPDKGFNGEVKELKIDCDCRKPKPGLLLQAAKDYNINLHESYMIGDSDSDVKAGEKAGCKTIKIDNPVEFWNDFEII